MSTHSRQSSSGTQYGPSPSAATTSPTGSTTAAVSTVIIEIASALRRSGLIDRQRLTDVYPAEA